MKMTDVTDVKYVTNEGDGHDGGFKLHLSSQYVFPFFQVYIIPSLWVSNFSCSPSGEILAHLETDDEKVVEAEDESVLPLPREVDGEERILLGRRVGK